MVKTEINRERHLSVEELRKEIRELRRGIDAPYKNFDESHRAMVQLAYNDVLKAVFCEELAKAKTPDEIRRVIRGEIMRDVTFCSSPDCPSRECKLKVENNKFESGEIISIADFSEECRCYVGCAI